MEIEFTTQKLIIEFRWSPLFICVSEKSKACNHLFITVKNSVVINKHPLFNAGVFVALNLNVYQDPCFGSILLLYTDQFVGIPSPNSGVTNYLLKVLIEEFMLMRPIDIGCGLGEKNSINC